MGLPPLTERDAMVDALKTLMEARDASLFMRGRLILPDPTFFPDDWEPSLDAVAAIIRRVLIYAGMDAERVEVEAFDPESGTLLERHVHADAAAWYLGDFKFGVNVSLLTDPEALAGVVAHEVAHAYRYAHGLVVEDRELEEHLTDLTAVFLGFGVLLANNTFLHTARGALIAGESHHSYHSRSYGYLSADSFGFLLALQALARGFDAEEIALVRKALLDNPRAAFDASLAHCRKNATALSATLSLERQRERTRAVAIAIPEPYRIDERAPERDAPTGDEITFRVTERQGSLIMAIVFGGLFAFVTAAFVSTWAAPVPVLVLSWIATRKRSVCSRPGCGLLLRESDAFCAGCGAKVVGELRNRAEMFEAEERYRKRI